MIIERTSTEVIFRLPSTVSVDDLQDLTDLFEFREIGQKSTASQEDVNELVKSIKKGRWEKTKSKLGA